jgi:hypothetical protein
MVQPISTPQEVPLGQRKAGSVVAVAAAGLAGALLLGALGLWFHYGTAVFFETIASGIAACF